MDDNHKKPNRGKGPRPGGSGKDVKSGEGGKRFGKPAGPRTFSKPAGEGGERKFGGPRPFRKDGEDGGKRFGKPAGPRTFSKPAGEGGERKFGGPRPFRKDGEDGGKRFGKPAGPRTFSKPAGEGGERKFDGPRPFRKDGEDGGKRFGKPAGPRTFSKPAGEGGERKFDGPRPFRKDGEDGGKRFGKPAGPRTFSKPAGEGGERKFDGPRPFRKDGEDGGKRFERQDRPRTFSKPAGEGGERKFDGPRPFRNDGEDGGKRFERQDRPRKFDNEKPPRRDGAAPRSFGARPDDRRAPATQEDWADGERIAKRLARAGISSRRDAETLIAAGRVRVNGRLVETPALNVSASDRIELDGEEIPAIERTRLFLFHKPAGVVTTNRDPEGRKTVFEVLPENLPRLMTVGRLDINTEGLLLLTNDGGLSRILELPATGWLRRYRVRVHGTVDEARLAGLKEGIAVEGVFYGAVEAALERTQGTNAWLTIGLREGKNREVKNIMTALGLEVTRLIRVSYGPFQLNDLAEGHVLEIKGRMLRDQLGERLIEESGANFDADIASPFPNRPVRRGWEANEPREPVRRPREMSVGEGGLVKGGFRRDRANSREKALGRLSTRPDRPRSDGDSPRPRPSGKPDGAKPARSAGGKRDERDSRPIEPPGARRANVWMAPGARPQGKRPSERAAERRSREDGAEAKPRPPFAKDGKRFDKPDGAPRGPRGGGKPFGKPPRKG